MDEKQIRSYLRRQMGKTGWALLIYYGILNVAVIGVLIIDLLAELLRGGEITESVFQSSLLGNAWGYILASLIGVLLILVWKKKKFFFVEMWQTEKPMTAGNFFVLLLLFISVQGAFQVLAWVMESVLNLFGFSVLNAITAASGTGDTFSMFLYVGLVAPVMEEIVFRGVLLRMLQPYGKRLAILATAYFFGMFHGNPVQSPYAFGAGLILGYVAIEYSIGWAMVLHMFNNLILGDTFTRVADFFPTSAAESVFSMIIWGSVVASVIILICNRHAISQYRQADRIHPWCTKAFFGAPGVIVFTVLMAMSMLAGITQI